MSEIPGLQPLLDALNAGETIGLAAIFRTRLASPSATVLGSVPVPW
ncbi:hypothetical protein [Luteococcus sp.]